MNGLPLPFPESITAQITAPFLSLPKGTSDAAGVCSFFPVFVTTRPAHAQEKAKLAAPKIYDSFLAAESEPSIINPSKPRSRRF